MRRRVYGLLLAGLMLSLWPCAGERSPTFYQMSDQEWKEFVWNLRGDVVFDLALALAPENEPYGRDEAPEVVTP